MAFVQRALPSPPKLSMYLLWNFFQNIPPPPAFPTFVEGWRHTGSYVRKDKCFLVTQLHRNLDPKGTFPYVNHAAFDGPDYEGFKGPTPEFIAAVEKGHGPPDHQKKFPGGYEELVTSTKQPLSPWLGKNSKSLWILTGFRIDKTNSADTADFEANLSKKSGADFIVSNSPKEFGVTKVALYKQFSPMPAMEYVLRAELPNGEDSLDTAWSFLEQLRSFTYPSYVTSADSSLYKTDEENTLFPDEGRKKLPEGHAWQDE